MLLVPAKACLTLGVVTVRLEVYTVRFVSRRVATFCSASMQRLNTLNYSADCAHRSSSQMYTWCEVSQNFLCHGLETLCKKRG
jgi:hypothetical protein